MISQDNHYSYIYVRDVLQGRFELGELVISQDCYYSWSYAIDVMKGRFKLGEEVISKDACDYLINAMRYDHE